MLVTGIKRETLGADVVFYVYAILSSNFFLDKFEGALYSTSTWPKIPIFKGDTFRELALLGRKIAECEKNITGDPARACEILPGNGIRLQNSEINVPAGTIILNGDDSQRYVVDGLGSACLGHSISGYSVFEEYLKRNKWAYLNRNFTNKDVLRLYSLNDALSSQFELIRQADRLIEDALEKQELIEPP